MKLFAIAYAWTEVTPPGFTTNVQVALQSAENQFEAEGRIRDFVRKQGNHNSIVLSIIEIPSKCAECKEGDA